jgi:glucose-6-phosphate isomerase
MTLNSTLQALQTSPTYVDPKTGFTLDISGMDLTRKDVLQLLGPREDHEFPLLESAHLEMKRIEAGDIKNPDEGRQVTHFTDRKTYPDTELFQQVEQFAEAVRANPELNAVIINGIGGSALGPQLLQWAIHGPYWNELSDKNRRGYPRIYFLDNTDPAGLADIMAVIEPARTLVVTISKSGSTQETRNNMIALEKLFSKHNASFADNAVAVTMEQSELWNYARENQWRQLFPMAESIGGRTSVTNIVGHLPAALAGIDFDKFVRAAAYMDELTRVHDLVGNPAYQLAAAWFAAGNGKGDRNMVILPYSDRLILLGRYLQQLVMESLGKEKDIDGRIVHQGLTVYGNKGGTDAHAYVQQLQDGRDDFFVTFIEPLADAAAYDVNDSPLTMGDYLHAFKGGLLAALRRKQRKVIDMVINRVDAENMGLLVALYERAVAVYAELITINAFNQPGVQAYKKAGQHVNDICRQLQAWIGATGRPPLSGTAADIAEAAGLAGEEKEVARLLNKFAVNHRSIAGKTVSRVYRKAAWEYAFAGE